MKYALIILFAYLLQSPDVLAQFKESHTWEYVGGFKLPVVDKSTGSSFNFAAGAFALGASEDTIFVVGHVGNQGIAELKIPSFKGVIDVKKMKNAIMLQPFSKVFNKVKKLNTQKINRITGLKVIENQLFVNGLDFYDAAANNTHTTLIVRDPKHLSKSDVAGFFETRGRVHAAGWISDIPKRFAQQLKSEYLVGYASNMPITQRSSVGPSFFTFNPPSVLDKKVKNGMINTQTILDFSLKKPLNKDLYNKSLKNDIWTISSKAFVGFINEYDEYMVIGTLAGSKEGLGYKIRQLNGKLCAGPCPVNPKDEYNYFWKWSMDKLINEDRMASKNLDTQPDDYGKVTFPHMKGLIIGAYYQQSSQLLYIMEGQANRISRYSNLPVIRVYQLK